jgi:putative Mn2+ efflux pump MntP
MRLASVFFVSIALAMDAFAVSVTNGVCFKKVDAAISLKFGAYFGAFQFAMPLAGYFIGASFARYIKAFDHWIAFGFLVFVGGSMIKDSFKKKESYCPAESVILSNKNMTALAVATSVDALAVGVSYAALGYDIIYPSILIGVVAFIFSAAGVLLGKKIGDNFKNGSLSVGGAILIFIGAKILIEHLYFERAF